MPDGSPKLTRRCPQCQTFVAGTELNPNPPCPTCASSLKSHNKKSIDNDEKSISRRGMTQGGSQVDVSLYTKTGRVLGKGAFGTVYLIKSQVEGEEAEFVALKEPKESKEEDAIIEADLLKDLKHPNVVQMKYRLEDHGVTSAIAFELINDGDLYKFIQKHYQRRSGLGNFTEVFGFQMFRGLAHLHRKNIVHRDMKPGWYLILNRIKSSMVFQFK